MTAPALCRIEFWVPGIPAPQGSKSFKGFAGNGRAIMAESSKKVKPWRQAVAVSATQAMRDAGAQPFTGPVTVDLAFIMPRPKTAPKLKVLPATKRPDVDKTARACLDALTGVCFVDDSQVVKLVASKRVALFGENPGCQITVMEGP
jgi:crossover junction endodeoxyribonuclease RusA